MTKAEARDAYLRVIGERTVNGSVTPDLDLDDIFNGLLNSSLIFVTASFPKKEVINISAENLKINVPENLAYITQVIDRNGMPVSFKRVGDQIIFARPCDMEYAKRPTGISVSAPDSTVLDIDDRYAQLVVIKCAIDAALSIEEYAYKVPSLTAQYNTLSEALDDCDVPSYRRVF